MAQEQAKLYEQYVRLKDGVSACAVELQRTMAFDYTPYYGGGPIVMPMPDATSYYGGGPIVMPMPDATSHPAMGQNQYPFSQQGFNGNLNLQQGK